MTHGPTTQSALGSVSTITARFVGDGSATNLERLHEAGSLRLRRPRGARCEAVIVNAGGGVVGGDQLDVDLAVRGRGAAATVTSVAAEKIYRSAGAEAAIRTHLVIGPGSTVHWLPQETILFDGARLRRTLTVEIAAEAECVAAELMVFGRLASGEGSICGHVRDSWRIRRDGALVFADETAFDGAIGRTLDRPALGGGARAVALLLVVKPDAERHLDAVRATLSPFAGDDERAVDGGASAWNGILVARLVARSPERLRACTIAALRVVRTLPLPRNWEA